MTFFEHQRLAKRATRLLIVLLFFSVIGVNLAVYFVVRAIQSIYINNNDFQGIQGLYPLESDTFHVWDPRTFGLTWVITTGVIVIGALVRLYQLRGGGASVAGMLGGKRVDTSSDDPKIQTLVNVVEEMSIASGCRIPSIYVIEGEAAINAFAAGYSQADSVIAVTQGALDKLDRDQLQGVVAHEFSHILNSDVKLNMNLIGAISGLLAVSTIGRLLLRTRTRSSRNNKGAAPIFLLGLGLFAVGAIGVLFARLIQACISRQREYLADASAVQFTRNPMGLAGALSKIQNEAFLTFAHPESDSVRHMMFVSSLRQFNNWFSTHPDIESRVQRLAPSFASLQVAKPAPIKTASSKAKPKNHSAVSSLAGETRERFVPSSLRDTVGSLSLEGLELASQLLGQIPSDINNLVHHVEGSKQIIASLLLIESRAEEKPKDFAKKLLSAKDGPEFEHLYDQIQRIPPLTRSALFEIAVNTLKGNEATDNHDFVDKCMHLIDMDGHRSFFESTMIYSLVKSLMRTGHRRHGKSLAHNKHTAMQILASCSWVGSPTVDSAQKSLQTGLTYLANRGFALKGISSPEKDLVGKDLYRALQTADELHPEAKEVLLTACAAVFGEDGMISPDEKAYLRMLASSIGTPIPLI